MGPRNPNRNAQFENIARLKKEYLKAGLPVISMDTKKKELLGNFYREGKIDTQETIETNDHDFGSAGVGTVIPHSLYDVGKNKKGFVHLNTATTPANWPVTVSRRGVGGGRPGPYPKAEELTAVMRWQRQRWRDHVFVQRRPSEAGKRL